MRRRQTAAVGRQWLSVRPMPVRRATQRCEARECAARSSRSGRAAQSSTFHVYRLVPAPPLASRSGALEPLAGPSSLASCLFSSSPFAVIETTVPS